jgi:2-dehydropantoate 2-reductase
MRIAVFGVGGVGGYFGGRLAQAGEEVVFIARGEHLRALRTHGLRVESLKGDFVVAPVQATDDPAQVGAVDVVLVGVKAWQIPEVAPAMRPLIAPETYVVPLQNGLEAPAQLAAALGAEHVLGGTCAIYSFIAAPGCIRHIGLDPSVTFGELDKRPRSRAERLRQALERAGVTADIASDIQIPMWEKFLVLRWGIVGAVTRAPAGIVRSLPAIRQMVVDASQEVITVAQARHVVMADDSLHKSLAILDSLPVTATTSLQRDVMDGRPSEIDAQAGALVRLGQEVGVATPLHTFLYHSVLPMEMRARGQVQFPE